jgi:hypothetical protein
VTPSKSLCSLPSATGIEAGYACAAGAHAFGEGALRAELDFDLAGEVLALELDVLAYVARDHLFDLAIFEQKAEAESVDAGVVAGDGEMTRAVFAQGRDERLGDAAEAEAADGESHAVLHDSIERRESAGPQFVQGASVKPQQLS